MSFPPSVSDFEGYFTREFVYGSAQSQVTPTDIQRALNEASISFNPGLWDGVTPLGNTTEQNVAYMYLSAHYLTLNIQGAGGLSSINRGRGVKSAGGGTTQTKSVGSVSIAYAVPDSIQNDPILSQYMRTDFGQKYLSLLTPRLVGNVTVVSGESPGGLIPVTTNVANPLQITTLSLAGGTHSVAYSATVHATGGVGIYQWSVVSGTLPTGLSLGALTGTLSGTPSVAGTYYFEVQAIDNVGTTARMNYQVVIA